MPRTLRVALIAFALVAPPTVVRAQAAASIAAGASIPTGSLDDFHDVGYHLLLGVGVNPPLSPLGFRFEGMFNEFERSSPLNGNTRVLGLIANGVLHVGGLLGPYAIGGIGLYNTRFQNGGDDSQAGFNIGGGFRFGLTGFSAFAEARYHKVSGTGAASFIPITFGITF